MFEPLWHSRIVHCTQVHGMSLATFVFGAVRCTRRSHYFQILRFWLCLHLCWSNKSASRKAFKAESTLCIALFLAWCQRLLSKVCMLSFGKDSEHMHPQSKRWFPLLWPLSEEIYVAWLILVACHHAAHHKQNMPLWSFNSSSCNRGHATLGISGIMFHTHTHTISMCHHKQHLLPMDLCQHYRVFCSNTIAGFLWF